MTEANQGTRYSCTSCGKSFSVPAAALAKYPGWTPSRCLACRDKSAPAARAAASPRREAASSGVARTRAFANTQELNLSLDEVLARFTSGPKDGVFTDGACSGNPGPGGWGAVFVRDDAVVEQRYGNDADTTNNRMELTALINGLEMIPADVDVTVWTDSQLCERTINEWAAGWERNGWRRKSGPIANLELVQRLYRLSQQRPRAKIRWIKAHDGSRWNEYADALATAFLREKL